MLKYHSYGQSLLSTLQIITIISKTTITIFIEFGLQINVGEYRRGNQKWTIQDEDKQNKNTTQYVLDTTIRKHTQIT